MAKAPTKKKPPANKSRKPAANKRSKKAVSAKSASTAAKKLAQPKPPAKPPKKIAPVTSRPPITTVWKTRAYLIFSGLILLGTTLWWSWQGARIESANADQLVDALLFQNNSTFQGAFFPGTHTFLLKWPLFWLISLSRFSTAAFTAVTIGLSLLTVGGLAFILARIERRPLLLANFYLALASVLWLVPAQLQPGTLLPVNMAMITTRNLEYIVYLAGLIIVIKSRSGQWWRITGATALLAVVFASDKLFLVGSLASSAVGFIVYGILRRYRLRQLFARWLLVSVVAAVAATIVLYVIDGSDFTNIVGSAAATPYGSSQFKRLLLGAVYALSAVLTNFGANPAFDVTILRAIPAAIGRRLLTPSGLGFLINFGLLVSFLLLAGRLLRNSLYRAETAVIRKLPPLTVGAELALLLIWNSGLLLVIFVISNHYYAGDARYLTLIVFTLFIAAATQLRQVKLRPIALTTAGVACLFSLVIATPLVVTTARQQKTAYDQVAHRNQLVSLALKQHPVSTIVGDYWRLVPIKASHPAQSIVPLQTCTQPRTVLTSQQWQPDLRRQSFAYLLSADRSLTDFPHCSLSQIVQAYGRPNASVLLKGSLTNPQEQLLFYDRGIRQSTVKRPVTTAASSLIPASLDHMRQPVCGDGGKTIMNVVAHQDDDLLFMNPDLLHDIRSGACVRTVYITAGDAGADKFYWLGREQGSEAAYDYMRQRPSGGWEQRTVKLGDHEYATIVAPHSSANQSLIFLHLPDGNVDGSGFTTSHNESLAKLEDGTIPNIQTVDGQSSYSQAELVNALNTIMNYYRPAEIRTQANFVSTEYPDHSDHMAVGRLTKQAYDKHLTTLPANSAAVPLHFYIGYPIHAMDPNVGDADLTDKQNTFFQYARFDGGVCHSLEECNDAAVYGIYLERQYQNDN